MALALYRHPEAPSPLELDLGTPQWQNRVWWILFREAFMRRLGFLIWAVSVLIGGGAWAQELTDSQHWVEQVGGSVGIPLSDQAAEAWDPGFGGDLSIGYRLDPHFSLGIGTGYHQFDFKNPPAGISGDFSYVPLQATARYTFGPGDLKAYFVLGAGVAINTGTTHGHGATLSSTETDFLLSPGVGALLVVDPKAAIFVQAKLDMDFMSKYFASDAVTLLVPLDAGLIFYIL
jgi:hypothetical protein